MATDYYFWGTSKSKFAKREGKYGLLMHALIPTAFFLRFTTFFLSFLLSILLLLVSYYSLAVGCSLFGLFFSWVPLSR